MPTAAAVIACALALLGKSETTMPPIVLVDVPPVYASRDVEAYVRTNDDTIYVVTSSPLFRAVQGWKSDCGDPLALKKLASVLIHEEWHVRHRGDDEQAAYYAQLTALVQLGVSPGHSVYTGVMRSMQAVDKKRKQKQKPEMVLADRARD
jgi:hypothetical protein